MQSTIATTRTPGHLEPARVLLAGVVLAAATSVAAIAVTIAPSLSSSHGAVTPADASYTQVESARGAAFGAASWDGSYDRVEGTRSQVVLPAAADNSYNDIERLR